MIDTLAQFFGRLHPVLLHTPIGVLVALGACEAVALARGAPLDRAVRLTLIWLAALSGLGAGGGGWLLAEHGGYGGSTLTLHRWLGVALTGVILLAAIAATSKKPRVYAALLLASLGVMVPAGHFGATITHGPGFLTEPFRARSASDRADRGTVGQPAALPGFPPDVGAIFLNHCVTCHGESKQKGGLAMHSLDDLLAGADYGPVVVAGDPDESELVIRLFLPLGDEYHMPPEDKPQLTEAEIAAIIAWVESGIPADTAPAP